MVIFESMKKWKFSTFIFELDQLKNIKMVVYDILIVLVILAVMAIVIFEPLFLVTLILFGLQFALRNVIKEVNLKRTIKSYGTIKRPIVITDNAIQIDNQEIAFSEMDSLIIYVDEYYRMPKHVFWKHHGGNNEIRITKNGKTSSFHYYIGSKGDFHYMEHLVAKIEEQYPPAV